MGEPLAAYQGPHAEFDNKFHELKRLKDEVKKIANQAEKKESCLIRLIERQNA